MLQNVEFETVLVSSSFKQFQMILNLIFKKNYYYYY